MSDKKNCQHRSFELADRIWKCQWCKKEFTALDIEKIMLSRRQGFDNDVSIETAKR